MSIQLEQLKKHLKRAKAFHKLNLHQLDEVTWRVEDSEDNINRLETMINEIRDTDRIERLLNEI